MNRPVLLIFVLFLTLTLTTCDLLNPGLGNGVDLSPPFLTVISHQNGSYVKGTITLSGTYTEDVAAKSIEVSTDGTTFLPAAFDPHAHTWSLSMDTTTILDGEHDVIFRVTDTSNKQTDKKILLYVDNTPPLVIITAPYTYGGSSMNYDVMTLKGETYDTFGMQKVNVTILDASDVDLNPLPQDKTANGTSSWSYSFDSKAYIAATGTLKFVVIGIDKAGNISTNYYHYKDIYEQNSLTAIVVDDIYKILHGQLTNAPVKTFLDANGTTPIPYYFDQDQSKPTIKVFNPDNTGAANNMFTSTSKLNGQASDEVGIKADSLEYLVTKDSGATVVIPWTSTHNALVDSLSWSFYLPGNPPMVDGDYELTVRATDSSNNQRVQGPVGFKIDSGAPTLTVSQPTQGQYLGANFTISGTASDTQGIKKVEVSLDDGLNYVDATGTTSWSYSVTNAAEAPMLIKVRAVENTVEEKKTTYNLQVIVDKTNPDVSFLNPPQSSTVNGLVLVKGTSSDNSPLTNVEIRLGKDSTWIAMSNMYNWEYQIDATNYTNSTYSDEEAPPGSDVWKFYVHARVTDRA
jgi:large repetitive protein